MASQPMQLGIEGLNATPFMDFRGGRVTMDNLSEMRKEELLLANNILILADRMPKLRPGYTLVGSVGAIAPGASVIGLYDFQRSVDGTQFILVQPSLSGPMLYLDPAAAYAAKQCGTFPTGGAPTGPGSPQAVSKLGTDRAAFITLLYEALAFSQGGNLALLDTGDGKLSAVPAGLPVFPTLLHQIGANPNNGFNITLQPGGSLSPVYGYTYAFCWVRKWTDINGNTYTHVGAPGTFISPVPNGLSNQQILISLAGFPQPNPVGPTHIWIFRTNDLPPGTTAALFFDAEITLPNPFGGAPVTYLDDNPDSSLDLTRAIPYTNYPPPNADIAEEYLGNILLAGIPGAPDLVQMSGGDSIQLGIAQEAFPPDLFFDIPGGRKAVTAIKTFNQKCYISSPDFWWTLTGYDVSTFQLRDKATQPGAIGGRAVCITATHLVYLSEDRNLYAWDGVSLRPEQFSKNLSKQLVGSLSMQDIAGPTLAQAEVRWFHDGPYNIIMVMVNTGSVPAGQFDWIQMWDASFLGQTYDDDVTPVGLVETDFFPSDAFSCSEIMLASNDHYFIAGDVNGNVYRWPDGQQDNGKNFSGALGTPWSSLNVFIGPMFHPIPQGEVVKRLFWADLHTDRQDTISSFQMLAVVADSPDMTLAPLNLPVKPLPRTSAKGPAPTGARANFLATPGATIGRWCRMFIVYPGDGGGGTLTRLAIWAKPIYGGAP